MKKIILTFLLSFFLISCSWRDFDKTNFQEIKRENYSFLIPKDWTFSEWKYSQILKIELPKENDFSWNISTKTIPLKETWATFDEHFEVAKNRKWFKKVEDIVIDNINWKIFFYEKKKFLSEEILLIKWKNMFKIQIDFSKNSKNYEKIQEILKNIKFY